MIMQMVEMMLGSLEKGRANQTMGTPFRETSNLEVSHLRQTIPKFLGTHNHHLLMSSLRTLPFWLFVVSLDVVDILCERE